MNKKYLGGQVDEQLHKAAHVTARLAGLSLNAWLAEVVAANLHPDAKELFFADSVQFTMHSENQIEQPRSAL